MILNFLIGLIINNLSLIGLIMGSVGAFSLIFETISGGYIRPKIYSFVLKGVCESNPNGCIVKIKLNGKEIRVLIWITIIFSGFIIHVVSFFV